MSAVADGRVIIEAILDTANVSKNVSGLGKELSGISWKNIAEGDSKAQALSGAFKSAGTACTMSFTAPIVAAGGAFAGMSMDFDNAMAKVSTIADTSEVPLDDLRASILDLSDDTGIAASDIADNVYNAISAGQSTGDAVNFVSNAAKLATAGFTDSASALDILSTTMNAYGMEADQVNRVSDVLLMTQNKGKTTVGELSAQMGKVIPTASAYGVSLENLAAAYATTTAKGIATAESTTYISGMLNELGDSGSEVGKIVKEKLGMSFKECMDSGMSLGEVLGSCKEYADENGVSLNELFGSAEAGKAALAIAGDGIEGFTTNLDAMNNSAGATDEAFEKMQTDSWDINKAINEVKNVMIDLGSTIVDTLRPAIEGFVGGVKGFTDWFKSIGPEGQQIIVTVAAIVAAIGPILSVLGTLIPMISSVVGFVTACGGAMGVLSGVMTALMSPVTLVVAGIAALIAILVYLWNTNEGFRDAVVNAWNAIMSAIQEIMAVLVPILQTAWDTIVAIVVPLAQGIADAVGIAFTTILNVITAIMGAVSGVISGVWQVIQGIFQTVVGFIVGLVTGDFSMMSDGVSSILNGLSEIVSSIWNGIMDAVGAVINGIGDAVANGWNTVCDVTSSLFGSAADTIGNIMGDAENVVSGALDSIAGFFRGLHIEWPHIPLPHFEISGSFNLDPANFSVPSLGISWYAKGGVFNGPSVIGVGEAGPEAAVPLSGRRMQPFAEEIANQMGGGNGDIHVQVTVEEFNNYTEADLDALVERVMRDIQRKLERQKRAKGRA